MSVFNNREIATLLLLGALVVAGCLNARDATRSMVRRLFGYAGFIIAIQVAYVCCLIWVAAAIGAWNGAALSEALFWFFSAGLAALFSITKHGHDGYFLRKLVLRVMGWSILFEFYLNLFVFSLVSEIAFQALVSVAVAGSVLRGGRTESMLRKKVCDAILSLIGLFLITYSIYRSITDWRTVATWNTVREFGTPIWLTIGSIPLLWCLAVYMGYEQHFRFLRLFLKDDAAGLWRVRLGLVVALRHRHYAVPRMNAPWVEAAAGSGSIAGAAEATKREIERVRQVKVRKEVKEAARQAELDRFSGVSALHDGP